MRNRRVAVCDRRQAGMMPQTPFTDSNGVTVWECRRKIPDRRVGNILAEWIDEIVLD